jgi:membrane-bound serine protease (ClpP class)
MGMILLAIGLYLVSAALMIIEIFVPSFGVLGCTSLATLAGGIYIFFGISPAAGWVGCVIAAILIPTVIFSAYKVMPHTRFGKTVILAPPEKKPGEGVPDAPVLSTMMGRIGTVITPLRPVGTCRFDELRLECVAETGFVERNRKVKVIRVDGTQLTVRFIEEN